MLSEFLYQNLQNKRNEVRAFQDNTGATWFAAIDVCKILEIGNPSQAITRLDSDERQLVDRRTLTPLITNKICKSNIGNVLACISEPGLYRLIFTSRKPEAERFKRWVFHEVLPSIRKTGKYELPVSKPEEHVPEERKALPEYVFSRRELIQEKGMPYREERVTLVEVNAQESNSSIAQRKRHIEQLEKEQEKTMENATEEELNIFKLASKIWRE